MLATFKYDIAHTRNDPLQYLDALLHRTSRNGQQLLNQYAILVLSLQRQPHHLEEDLYWQRFCNVGHELAFAALDNEEEREKGKKNMLWGIIGMTIMVGVFGIITIILNTFGISSDTLKIGL